MRTLLPSFLLLALVGCPVDNPSPLVAPAQCEGAGYTAFDIVHHAQPDARVDAYQQIKGLLEEGVDDIALAPARFAEAQVLYQDTAELQGKVRGTTDDHLADRPNVGTEIDARIVAAFASGSAATSALSVTIAAETIDKSLVEFLFLSVFHELVLGQASAWDQAYGYYGSGADNALDAVVGFAGVAKRRDADNGTSHEARIFQSLVDGSCVLAGKLAPADGNALDSIDVPNDEDMSAVIDDIDVAMRAVLALSVGHEAFAIEELQEALLLAPSDQALLDEARVKLVELDAFFLPLERLLRAEGAVVDADVLRGPVDAALEDTSDAWVTTFDAAAVLALVENTFGVDVIK